MFDAIGKTAVAAATALGIGLAPVAIATPAAAAAFHGGGGHFGGAISAATLAAATSPAAISAVGMVTTADGAAVMVGAA